MRTATTFSAIAGTLLLAACGGGGGDTTSPGPTATTVAISAGDNQVAPVSTALTDSLAVLVKDNNNQPMPGVTVAWAATGGGTIAPTNSQTGVDGIARARRTLGATAGTAGTTATVGGLPVLHFTSVGQVQGGVTIATNPTGTLTDTVLGTLIDPEPRPSVKVTDQNGTPVAGVMVTWSSVPVGAVTSTSVPTDAGGISTVGYTFSASAAIGYQAHATVTGLVGSPVNFNLTATAGAPTQLAKFAGDGSLILRGTSVPLTALVSDGHGNPVAGVAIDWATTTAGGSVAPPSNTTGSDGRAIGTRTVSTSLGTQTTSATAASLPGSPSVSFSTLSAALVTVTNNTFPNGSPSISVGDSVAWRWSGVTAAHNITFDPAAGAPANEPDRTTGLVWRVFNTAGTYNYQCTNHVGMVGTVTVTP